MPPYAYFKLLTVNLSVTQVQLLKKSITKETADINLVSVRFKVEIIPILKTTKTTTNYLSKKTLKQISSVNLKHEGDRFYKLFRVLSKILVSILSLSELKLKF